MRSFVQRRADELEAILNTVNDHDSQWWPFVFLRPEQGERMTSLRVLALSLLLGTFFGMLANVAVALTGGPLPRPHVLVFPVSTAFGFFAIFRATFAYSWNRRAARLRAHSRRPR
jgi:hypothetical protein